MSESKRLPERSINLIDKKDEELFEYLKEEISKNPRLADSLSGGGELVFSSSFTDTVRKKIHRLDAEYCGDTLKMMDQEDFSYIIETYKVSEKYKLLNEQKYSIIRNGFITIGGEASSGKTSFAAGLALDILQHNSETAFIFYSLDDGTPISGKRLLSQLNEKNLFYAQIDEKHPNRINHLHTLKRILLRDRINLDHLDREVSFVKSQTSCKKIIMVVDYLQLMPAPPENSGDKRQAFNENLKLLKTKQQQFEKDGGCIVFCLSQLNRDKNGTFHYRETSEIENQSDVCMDIEVVENEKKDTGKRVVKILKNKMGMRDARFDTDISDAFVFSTLTYAKKREEEDVPKGRSKKTSIIKKIDQDRGLEIQEDEWL